MLDTRRPRVDDRQRVSDGAAGVDGLLVGRLGELQVGDLGDVDGHQVRDLGVPADQGGGGGDDGGVLHLLCELVAAVEVVRVGIEHTVDGDDRGLWRDRPRPAGHCAEITREGVAGLARVGCWRDGARASGRADLLGREADRQHVGELHPPGVREAGAGCGHRDLELVCEGADGDEGIVRIARIARVRDGADRRLGDRQVRHRWADHDWRHPDVVGQSALPSRGGDLDGLGVGTGPRIGGDLDDVVDVQGSARREIASTVLVASEVLLARLLSGLVVMFAVSTATVLTRSVPASTSAATATVITTVTESPASRFRESWQRRSRPACGSHATSCPPPDVTSASTKVTPAGSLSSRTGRSAARFSATFSGSLLLVTTNVYVVCRPAVTVGSADLSTERSVNGSPLSVHEAWLLSEFVSPAASICTVWTTSGPPASTRFACIATVMTAVSPGAIGPGTVQVNPLGVTVALHPSTGSGCTRSSSAGSASVTPTFLAADGPLLVIVIV